MGLLERTKKPISSLRSGRKCRMKFELIRSLQNLEWYGNIPCLPINYNSTEGKRDPFREIGVSHVFEDRR